MVFEKSFLRDFFIAEIAQDLKKKNQEMCSNWCNTNQIIVKALSLTV